MRITINRGINEIWSFNVTEDMPSLGELLMNINKQYPSNFLEDDDEPNEFKLMMRVSNER